MNSTILLWGRISKTDLPYNSLHKMCLYYIAGIISAERGTCVERAHEIYVYAASYINSYLLFFRLKCD